jgi:DNA-binding NtrC family response regulator
MSGFTPEAAAAMTSYGWPGNVRELQNVIERAVVLARDNVITPSELPGLAADSAAATEGEWERIADVEKAHIEKMLIRMEWNIGKSAEVLGIHRNTLRAKIKEYNLSRDQ